MSEQSEVEQGSGDLWQIRQSGFGDYIHAAIPHDCNMVVVCVNRWEHIPITVLLPHQLYVERAEAMLRDNNAHSLTIIPFNSASKVTISAQALARTQPSAGSNRDE